MNNKRFTFKWLGVFMETANYNPKETRKTIWTITLAIAFLLIVGQLSDLIALFMQN